MLCIYITKIYPFPRSVCKRLNIFFLELITKNILRKRFISTHTQRLAHYDHIHPPQLKQDPKYPPSFQFTPFEFLCRCALFLLAGLYGRQTKRSFHSITQLHDYKPSVASTSAVFVGACWLARCVKPNR